jgi:hypothetical protein
MSFWGGPRPWRTMADASATVERAALDLSHHAERTPISRGGKTTSFRHRVLLRKIPPTSTPPRYQQQHFDERQDTTASFSLWDKLMLGPVHPTQCRVARAICSGRTFQADTSKRYGQFRHHSNGAPAGVIRNLLHGPCGPTPRDRLAYLVLPPTAFTGFS